MLSETDSGIRIEDGKVIFGMVQCQICDGIGIIKSRKDCLTCLGTGLGMGPRGGKKACKDCSGTRTVADPENPVTCSSCKGSGKTRANDGSWLSQETWRRMDFFVYRTKRNLALSQFQLNRQCCYTHRSSPPQTESDTQLAKAVSGQKGFKQVRWICKPDGRLADHIGIFLCPDGYAVLPVFGDEEFIGQEFYVPK
jgi:hypothetical protein